MRTMILALAVVLLAAPVWADVTITLTDISDTVVEVGYEATGERPRAFALDLKVTEGTITDVTDFVIGDDNFGFGIFPANFSRYITVNPSGDVDDWQMPGYTPVADGGDPGALDGLDSNGVTLEMGALYDSNAPPMTGVLCRVTVDYEGSTELCVIGNALRGNVVLEDATEVDPVEACITLGGDCFPSNFTTYNDWVSYGKPPCWCHSTATPPGTGDYQCDGDADTKTSGPPFNYQIYTGDLSLVVANWKKKGFVDPNPCADIDHKDSGPPFRYRVYTADLSRLVGNWKKKATALPGNCGLPSRPE